MYRFINLKHHHYYCFTTRIFISLFILFSLLNRPLIFNFSPRYFLTLCIFILKKSYSFFLRCFDVAKWRKTAIYCSDKKGFFQENAKGLIKGNGKIARKHEILVAPFILVKATKSISILIYFFIPLIW